MLDIYTEAVKLKTIRIQKHQEPPSCWDLPVSSHHLIGKLLSRKIRSVNTNYKNPVWTEKVLWISINDPNVQKQNLEGENFNMHMTENHCIHQIFLQEKVEEQEKASEISENGQTTSSSIFDYKESTFQKRKKYHGFLKALSNSILKTKQTTCVRPQFFPQNNERQNHKQCFHTLICIKLINRTTFILCISVSSSHRFWT